MVTATQTESDASLSHYGIKGMKWGVNSFMKQSGKKKISDCDKSWADYALDEVQKSGWG